MKARFLGIVAIATLSFFAGILSAHHATDAVFDLDKLTVLKGIVSGVSWVNPHTYMFMDVTTCKVDNWAVELGSLPAMYRVGLNKEGLKPGMALSVLSAPAKRTTDARIPEAEEAAKARRFVLGGCLTLPDGRKVEYPEGPACPKPVKAIPEEGVFLK